jgi:hypothetical protein
MSYTYETARQVLRDNDRGGYTVPTHGLYPYQWNWDSAFVAMGWIGFDEARAWREIEKLLEGQWDDGMVAHIIFHQPTDTYFPGPDVWKVKHTPPTSGLTQPAVLASAARYCWDHAKNRGLAEERLAAIYPKLLAWHRWWVRARDPENSGLVAMMHPWESGMDNSPAWDEAFARVAPTPTSDIRRKDIGHVDPAMRPSEEFYKRVVALIDFYASLGWDPVKMFAQTPFKVAELALNAILHRANLDLLALAARFGTAAEGAEIAARLETTRRAIDTLWDADAGIYKPRDLLTGRRIDVGISAGFLPLWAGIPDPAKTAALGGTLKRWATKARFLVPSTDPHDPRFEPKRYWRGPVWGVVNLMIGKGFADAGASAIAARIRQDTAQLMQSQGFSEYFDPMTGTGIGGAHFSWTAAVALVWNLLDKVPAEA